VPATVPHNFHDIEEELVLVVFWAPPEDTVAVLDEHTGLLKEDR
jgi:hypothetical protein